MSLSLRDIAHLADVSPATVSRVFSGRAPVAESTKARILALAADHGFRPSAIGQVAFGGPTRSIGVLMQRLAVSFFADITNGLQQTLLEQDYLPMILQRGIGSLSEARMIQRLLDHRVDGMILLPSDESLQPAVFEQTTKARPPAVFEQVTKAGLPIVFIGSIHPSHGFDVATNDDVAGGRIVGEHLLALGHRRFGFVSFGAGHANALPREEGLRSALDQSTCPLHAKNIVRIDPFDSHREQALEADLFRILSRRDRPTAFVLSADTQVEAVLKATRTLGLRIPRDLSVVGFGNLNFSSLMTPPLTTVEQNGRQLGQCAARIILARLENPSIPLFFETIPVRLVVRESTAHPAVATRK